MVEEKLIKIKVEFGEVLDNVVNRLIELRNNGKLNYYAVFSDVKLYSKDVTLDSAYLAVVGKTKAEYEKSIKERQEKVKELLAKAAKRKLPECIEEGKKYIYQEKFEMWKEECVRYYSESANNIFRIREALDLMKLLDEKKSLKEVANEMQKQGNIGIASAQVLNIVLKYSNDGPKFYKYVLKKNINKYDKKYMEKMEELNKWLSFGLKYDEVASSLKEYKTAEITIVNNGLIEYGTILIKNDMTFEGTIFGEEYICGKISKDNSICMSKFTIDDIPSIYYFKKDSNESKIQGFKTNYPIFEDNIVKSVSLELTPCNLDFKEEIAKEIAIDEVKQSLVNDDQLLIEVFKDEIDINTKTFVSLIKDNKNVKKMRKKYN